VSAFSQIQLILSRLLIAILCLLALYILLAVTMPAASGPLVRLIGDKLDWKSRRLAGWSATDCGRVEPNADGTKASACVLKAFQDKKPFRVRYDLMSIDEVTAHAIVGARDGHVYQIGFDGGYGG